MHNFANINQIAKEIDIISLCFMRIQSAPYVYIYIYIYVAAN